MATFLQGLFGEEAIVDNREPLFTFWIPHVDGTFGLFAPDPNAWKLLAIVSYVRKSVCFLFLFVGAIFLMLSLIVFDFSDGSSV